MSESVRSSWTQAHTLRTAAVLFVRGLALQGTLSEHTGSRGKRGGRSFLPLMSWPPYSRSSLCLPRSPTRNAFSLSTWQSPTSLGWQSFKATCLGALCLLRHLSALSFCSCGIPHGTAVKRSCFLACFPLRWAGRDLVICAFPAASPASD